jgi:hypothetical protein
MEEEDQAVLSEMKIEIDVAEEPPEYCMKQQQVSGEWCTVSRKRNSKQSSISFVIHLGTNLKMLKRMIILNMRPHWFCITCIGIYFWSSFAFSTRL